MSKDGDILGMFPRWAAKGMIRPIDSQSKQDDDLQESRFFMFAGVRHFIFTFKNSTIERNLDIANGFP
jgi:hypothetical protein